MNYAQRENVNVCATNGARKMSVVREIKVLCLFNKKDKCNSDYAKGLECNGVHPPKKCPYHYNLNPKEMKLKLK